MREDRGRSVTGFVRRRAVFGRSLWEVARSFRNRPRAPAGRACRL